MDQRPSRPSISHLLKEHPLLRIKLLFVLAGLLSMALSVSLYFSGHEQQGIYTGIWVPSIFSMGALMLAGEGDRR